MVGAHYKVVPCGSVLTVPESRYGLNTCFLRGAMASLSILFQLPLQTRTIKYHRKFISVVLLLLLPINMMKPNVNLFSCAYDQQVIAHKRCLANVLDFLN